MTTGPMSPRRQANGRINHRHPSAQAMRLDAFFSTEAWFRYERAYGDVPGTRAALLATAQWRTRVLDLRPDEATVWRGVRGSYHPIVNKLRKDPEVAIVDADSETFLNVCLPMQVRLEGGMTRTRASWDVQAEWLRTLPRIGTCWIGYRRGQPKAFIYTIIWRAYAYYGYGRTEEDGIHHALIWHAVRTLKVRGVNWFELGWQL